MDSESKLESDQSTVKTQLKNNQSNTESNFEISDLAIDLHNHMENMGNTLSDVNTLKKANSLTFQLAGNVTVEVDFLLALKGFPSMLNNYSIDSKLISLPNWVEARYLRDYFSYIERNFDGTETLRKNTGGGNLNFKKLTQLANYFENDIVLKHIFQFNIFPKVSYDNCISLISDAYKNCSGDVLNPKLKSLWFNLFVRTLDYMAKNLLHFLDDNKWTIKKLNKKILDEIIEKFLSEIYVNNIKLNFKNANRLVQLIIYLRDLKDDLSSDDNSSASVIFDLLHNEYLHLSCPDTICELSAFANPTFQLSLGKDLKYYYEEHKVTFHKQDFIFVVHYNTAEDTFSINLKMNPQGKSDVFSFVSRASIIEDRENDQINIRCINDRMTVSVLKVHSYKKYFDSLKNSKGYDALNLVINIKFCLIHSFLISYLNANFRKLFNNAKFNQLTKNILKIVLSNNTFQKENQDEIVCALINWLNDESNMYEEISDIIEEIQWEGVTLSRIFELMIRFPHLMNNADIENLLITAIVNKSKSQIHQFNLMKVQDKQENAEMSNVATISLGHEGTIKAEELQSDFHENNNSRINFMDSNAHLISYFFISLLDCSRRIDVTKAILQSKGDSKMKYCEKEHSNKNIISSNNIAHAVPQPASCNIKIEVLKNDTMVPLIPEMDIQAAKQYVSDVQEKKSSKDNEHPTAKKSTDDSSKDNPNWKKLNSAGSKRKIKVPNNPPKAKEREKSLGSSSLFSTNKQSITLGKEQTASNTLFFNIQTYISNSTKHKRNSKSQFKSSNTNNNTTNCDKESNSHCVYEKMHTSPKNSITKWTSFRSSSNN